MEEQPGQDGNGEGESSGPEANTRGTAPSQVMNVPDLNPSRDALQVPKSPVLPHPVTYSANPHHTPSPRPIISTASYQADECVVLQGRA